MVWLFWLLTLNSVVNPWIYMIFNVNLVESLARVCCPYQSECPCVGGDPRTGYSRKYKSRQYQYQSRNGAGLQTQVDTTITGIINKLILF